MNSWSILHTVLIFAAVFFCNGVSVPIVKEYFFPNQQSWHPCNKISERSVLVCDYLLKLTISPSAQMCKGLDLKSHWDQRLPISLATCFPNSNHTCNPSYRFSRCDTLGWLIFGTLFLELTWRKTEVPSGLTNQSQAFQHTLQQPCRRISNLSLPVAIAWRRKIVKEGMAVQKRHKFLFSGPP